MEALVQLLEVLFSETNPEKRRQAEATLDEAAKEPHRLLQLLLQVVVSYVNPDPQKTKALKLSSVTFLNKMIKNITEAGQMTQDQTIFYLRAIMEVASKSHLDERLGDLLSGTISSILFNQEKPFLVINSTLLEAIVPILREALEASKTLASFSTTLMCLRNILLGLMSHSEANAIIAELLTLLEKTVWSVIEQLVVVAKRLTESKGEGFGEEVPGMISKMNILRAWIDLGIELFGKAKKLNSQIVVHFIFSQDSTKILAQGVQFIIVVGSQRNDTLISNTGYKEYDDAVNRVKAKSLELANLIIEHIYMSAYSSKMASSPLFSFCMLNGPLGLITLMALCVGNYDRLEEHTQTVPLKQIYVGILRLLSNMLEDNNFYHIFSANKHKIVVEIVLVLLKSSEGEIRALKEDPQNFVNLALDTCEKQASETCKTEAAKFLESLCDHIDGCLSLVTIICCEAIKFACKGEGVESLAKSPILNPFSNTSLYLRKTPPELIIESCLLVMSDISYLTPKRKDIFQHFESTLLENFVALFDTPSTLIKCRIALMMGYYADNLFHHSNELFLKTIEFLLKGLAAEKTEKALSLQCADTLKTIIAEQELVSRLENFINNLIPHLCSMVSTMELPTFYELLCTIISCYSQAMDSSIIKLLESLVLRVDSEYKLLREKGEKNNMTINQCWNVIRAICEEEGFFPEFMEEIEKGLLPMFNYLVDPANIEFDDDILQILPTLIKRRGKVSENLVKLFPFLPKFFHKYKGVFGSLLPALNAYIFYGKDYLGTLKEWQETILQLGHSSLFNKKAPIELNNTEGAILYQIILQTLGNGILDPYIPTILQVVIQRLEISPSADYLTRQLYNVILCSICNNGSLTLNTIETMGKTEVILNGIFAGVEGINHSYDIKLMVIGLANILIHSTSAPYTAKYYPKILSVITDKLQKQAQEDTKKLLKADKKAISIEESDSDSSLSDMESDSSDEELMEESKKPKEEEKKKKSEDEDSEDEEMPRNPSEDVNMTLNMLQGQIKKIDEYHYLRKIVNLLYTQSAESMRALVGSLNEVQQNYLKSILQSKRVAIQRKGERTTVARRILKPKQQLDKPTQDGMSQ